jgi:FMNH2-dependent dimethyl sulfone monooxygenase
VGDPETVADELVAISDAGLAGMLLIFFDYRESLDLFADEVLPMLEAAGVREASGSTAE